jgi:hypothetical protein
VILLVLRRRGQRHDAVFGSLPDARSDDRVVDRGSPGAALAGPVTVSTMSTTGDDVPDVSRLTEAIRRAAADGHLSDEEIQQMLPGAQVTRDGEEIRVEHVRTAQSFEVDGTRYDRIEDIPDPAVRDQIRKMLGS